MLQSTNFTRDLVAYWKMEETSGNILDAHGSFDLSPKNGATLGATGKNGNAVDFDGVNDALEIASASSSDLSITGAFTVSAWFKVDTVDTTVQFIVAKFKTGGSIQYGLRIDGTSDLVECFMSSNGSTTTLAASSGAISTGTWYHVLGCYNPSTAIQIYLDGVMVGENTTSIPASVAAGTALFRMGDRDGGNRAFDGIIDEVAIWDAFRPELASELYRNGSGRFYDDF